MSRINDLIKEMCPNGVEYVKLEELVEYIQPAKYIVKSTNYDIKYDVPVLTAGQTFILGYTNEKDGVYYASADNPVIIFDDFTTSNHWVDFNFKVKSSAMKILISKTDNLFKYIYYCISNIDYVPKEHSRQWIQVYSKFQIPLPPLKVQEEIVRILDKFGGLEAELEAELEARKSQYEFWRGKLLNKKNNNYKKYNITEICKSVSAGGDVPEDTIKGISKPQDDYKYPVISNGVGENAIYGYSKNYRVDVQSCVTIAARGTIGYHEVRYGKFTPIIRLITLIPDEKIISAKYLHYALYGHEFKPSGGGIPQLTTPTVKQLDLIIPPVEEQNRIVGILDKFDKLVSNITDGLPAEIELRRKQYEYYRNKLLNFEDIQYE